MSLYEQYPHTDFHQLNLDFLLRQIKGILERLDSLEKRMDAAEADIAWLKGEVAKLWAEVAKLREEWEKYKAEMELWKAAIEKKIEDKFRELDEKFAELTALVMAKLKEMEEKLEAELQRIEHAIDDKFTKLSDELHKEIAENLKYIIDKCAEFTERVVRLEVRVENIEASMDACCNMINDKLKELLEAIGEGGQNMTLITKTITQNGTYHAADDNADGYSSVTVDVPTDADPTLEDLTVQSWANVVGEDAEADRTYSAADYNADGFETVTLSPMSNETKTITANGEYIDDSKTSRWGKVTVNVNPLLFSAPTGVIRSPGKQQITAPAPYVGFTSPYNIDVYTNVVLNSLDFFTDYTLCRKIEGVDPTGDFTMPFLKSIVTNSETTYPAELQGCKLSRLFNKDNGADVTEDEYYKTYIYVQLLFNVGFRGVPSEYINASPSGVNSYTVYFRKGGVENTGISAMSSPQYLYSNQERTSFALSIFSPGVLVPVRSWYSLDEIHQDPVVDVGIKVPGSTLGSIMGWSSYSSAITVFSTCCFRVYGYRG